MAGVRTTSQSFHRQDTERNREIADFSQITDRLFTGAAISDAADVQQLVDAGVTHILDARGELDDAPLLASHPQLSYLWNPTQDDGQPKPVEYWLKTLSFALPMFALPKTKLLCHCAAGQNRGPSNAFCVLVALGWSYTAAETLIRAARPQATIRYADDAFAACQALGYWM